MIQRPSKDKYFLKVAEIISERGTCLRRLVGAVIVKDGRIISTGYVGAPKGEPNCTDTEKCRREELNVPSGMFYEICRSVHAEENAVLNAASTGANINGATIYLFSKARSKEHYPKGQEPTSLYLPCYRCKKLIVNSGLKQVVIVANNKIKKISINELRLLIKKDEEKQGKEFENYLKK